MAILLAFADEKIMKNTIYFIAHSWKNDNILET